MTKIYNLTVFVEMSGKRLVIEAVNGEVTARELLEDLAVQINKPSTTKGVLVRKSTRKQMLPEHTLSEAGVQDNETLIADFEATAGGPGLPIYDFRDIQRIESILKSDVWSESYKSIAKNIGLIFAVFLYTKEDIGLATYVKEYIEELESMSGFGCFLLAVEEPSEERRRKIASDIQNLINVPRDDPNMREIMHDDFKPFDKGQAYNIATQFGLQPNQLPCVIFFAESDPNKALTLTVELNDYLNTKDALTHDFAAFFRLLFTKVRQSQRKPSQAWLEELQRVWALEQTKSRTKRGLSAIKQSKPLLEVLNIVLNLVDLLSKIKIY